MLRANFKGRKNQRHRKGLKKLQEGQKNKDVEVKALRLKRSELRKNLRKYQNRKPQTMPEVLALNEHIARLKKKLQEISTRLCYWGEVQKEIDLLRSRIKV